MVKPMQLPLTPSAPPESIVFQEPSMPDLIYGHSAQTNEGEKKHEIENKTFITHKEIDLQLEKKKDKSTKQSKRVYPRSECSKNPILKVLCFMGWVVCCPICCAAYIIRDKPEDTEDYEDDICLPCY